MSSNFDTREKITTNFKAKKNTKTQLTGERFSVVDYRNIKDS